MTTNKTMTGNMTIPNLDGYEICPGVTLIGEASTVVGTNKLRCLANVFGHLAVVELRIKFTKRDDSSEQAQDT